MPLVYSDLRRLAGGAEAVVQGHHLQVQGRGRALHGGHHRRAARDLAEDRMGNGLEVPVCRSRAIAGIREFSARDSPQFG